MKRRSYLVPIRDNFNHAKRPWATYSLCLSLGIINFIVLSLLEKESVNYKFGFVPVNFSLQPWMNILTLFSASFLHADWFHFFGNCIFLLIFGRSIEMLFGYKAFIIIFPISGAVGFALHWIVNSNQNVPVIGASAAISTIMGAYLVLFPSAKIKTLFVFGWFFRLMDIPGWIFIIYWAALQFFYILFSANSDSIAYYAHIGGFMAGVVAAVSWKVLLPKSEEILLEFGKRSFKDS